MKGLIAIPIVVGSLLLIGGGALFPAPWRASADGGICGGVPFVGH